MMSELNILRVIKYLPPGTIPLVVFMTMFNNLYLYCWCTTPFVAYVNAAPIKIGQ